MKQLRHRNAGMKISLCNNDNLPLPRFSQYSKYMTDIQFQLLRLFLCGVMLRHTSHVIQTALLDVRTECVEIQWSGNTLPAYIQRRRGYCEWTLYYSIAPSAKPCLSLSLFLNPFYKISQRQPFVGNLQTLFWKRTFPFGSVENQLIQKRKVWHYRRRFSVITNVIAFIFPWYPKEEFSVILLCLEKIDEIILYCMCIIVHFKFWSVPHGYYLASEGMKYRSLIKWTT